MAAKFTQSQLNLLRTISDKEFEFPKKGYQVLQLERMERMGFVESKLEPAVWDSRRGVTKFARAYRRTRGGKACCKRNPPQ